VRLPARGGASGIDRGQGERYDQRASIDRLEANTHSWAGEKMEIHLNITFPRIPCELLTLDVMDVSGEQQTGVQHGIVKVQLSPVKEGGRPLDISMLNL
jgi:hypothetical protein